MGEKTSVNAVNNINVAMGERFGSALIGGLLMGFSARRVDALSSLGLALGGYLVMRGITGMCFVYRELGIDQVAEPAPPLPQAFQHDGHENQEMSAGGEREESDRRQMTTQDAPRRRNEDAQRIVGEASEESFPASDAPGWTGT